MTTDHDDLILGVISAQRFMQMMAMLPAITLLSAAADVEYNWLGISFGSAGSFLCFAIIFKAVRDKRELPWQAWAIAIAQWLVTAWVLLGPDGPLNTFF